MSKFDDDDYRDYDDDDELDDLDDDELDDEEDDLAPRKPGSNTFGSGIPRTNPPPGSGLQPRPSGLTGSSSSGGVLGGNRPNLPGSPPAGGGFGTPRPNLPGSPPSGAPGSSGGLGGNRPNLPGSPPGGGGTFGSRPNLPGSPPGSSGGLGGNRPNLPGSPPAGGSTLGSRPNLPGSPPASPPGASPLGGSRPNLPGSPPGGGGFGSRPSEPPRSDGKPEEKKGGFGLGGFGKKDDKKDDKPSGGALGGLGSRLPFGKKDGDKKDGKPSGGALGGLGGLGSFGKKDDDKPSGGGNPLGSLGAKLPFGKKDDKPSGGGLGSRLPFGKKDDAPAPKPGGFGGGASSPSPLGSRPPSGPLGGTAAGGAKPAQAKSAKAEGGFFSRFTLPFGKKSDKPAKARTSKPVKVEQGGLSLDTRLDIIGVALTVVSLALLLSSLSPNQGALTGEVNRFLSYLFGWGAIAIPIAALAVGIWLILRHFGDEAPTLQIPRVIGIVILFLSLLAVFQYVEALDYQIEANADYLLALRTVFLPLSYNAGQGGGAIGAEIYYWLISSIGELGGFVILFVPIIVGFMLALSLSAAELALIIVSNVRNLRDGARRRAVRAAAERAKRQEAMAAARAQALAAQAQIAAPAPADALPPGSKPMLPGVVEAPVPMQMPLAPAQEPQRAIPITAGGRTVQATLGGENAATPAAPAAFNRPAAATTTPIGTTHVSSPTSDDKPQERGGLGRLAPAAIAGGMIGSAVKALTPTEESDEPEAKPEKRGFGLGGLAPKLPFGKKETTTPGAGTGNTPPDAGLARQAPTVATGAAQTVPPAIPPVSVRPPSLGGTPPATAVSDTGGGRDAGLTRQAPPGSTPSATPPRVGDLLRPQAPTAASTPPGTGLGRDAGLARTSSAPSDKPNEEARPAASLTPRPSGLAGGLSPRPLTSPPSPAGTPGGTTHGSTPTASPPPPLPSLLDDDDDEDSEDWKALPPARPRGDMPQTSRPTDSPFAPRVMGSRDTGSVRDTGLARQTLTGDAGASAAAPPDKSETPAQPAASAASATGEPPRGWQERMASISGKLPGGGDAPGAGSETSKMVAAGAQGIDVRRPGRASPFGERREPPRIVKMDEDNNEIDDLDDELEDDLPASEASGMKPISAASARPSGPLGTTPASSAPPTSAAPSSGRGSLGQASFPPPVRNPSSAFGKPDKPATDLPMPSPLKPAASVTESGSVRPEGLTRQTPTGDPVGTARASSAAMPTPPAIPPSPPAIPPATFDTGRDAGLARQAPRAPSQPAAERPAPIITQMSPPPPASAPAADAAPRARGRKEWRMPELGALLKTGSDQELDHAMLLQRAKTIEETLDAFGAPGRVVEVRTGPVITQFGVEPDYLNSRGGKKARVKVSAIAQLDKDLQLALGAKSIRIEAPVPGKGYVGIEVPNDQAAVVQLRDVMESEQFRRIKSPLGIALGQGVDGTPVAADLTGMPHLLIAGTTGSGKSVCVNSIIASLLLTNAPERLKFIMVDPKRVELTAYNGIPHLVAPVVVELERIVGVLKWVTREMDDRYRRFSGAGARNIEDYNKHLPQGEQWMPYIIVIIDELADLMMLAPDETERVITRLAALARATGIHLVIATQRPSVDVVTGLIKANFPARIAFAVAGSVDSRVILDQPGAERLLGRGDMLYMSGDSPAPQRLQGVFVSDNEINNITRFWRQQMDDSDLANQGRLTLTDFKLDEMTAKDAGDRRGTSQAQGIGMGNQRPGGQTSFWEGPSAYVSSSRDEDDMVDEDGDGEDDMYDEAVALVRQLRKASVSLLQRRLRIGYTRAAKLIDVMEDRGIVGPSQSGSTPRDVIG